MTNLKIHLAFSKIIFIILILYSIFQRSDSFASFSKGHHDILITNFSSFTNPQEKDSINYNDRKFPKRLKRSESFFGLHFDFHAGDDCKEIGKHTTHEMVEQIIKKVNPDFIQIDCKGHPGLSSYPTKVGNQAPGFVGDPLRIWREVTAKHGVSLYMHYSGVYDNAAVKKDSTWARVNADGYRDKNMNSTFGPYVDKLLIPQFKELANVYGVDGAWVDGDCWADANDYNESAIKLFQEKTGIKSIPRKPDDPFFFEFTEFNREGFKNYLKHYVDEMHKNNPNFQIASNWAYSSFMPEAVKVNVDFISGDFNYLNSYNSARFEGRCIANQGKSWDLMSWGFVYKNGLYQNAKTAIQLEQEAAVIMALGGGFQVYTTQNRDGSVSLWKLKSLEKLSKFCHERQKFCQYAKSVAQIALLFSRENFYRKITSLFGGWFESTSLKGDLYCLLDAQNQVDILSEHHLTGQMEKYPLIIIPEIEYLDSNFKKELLTYAKDGGKLLLIGQKTPWLFKEDLMFVTSGELNKESLQWLEYNGVLTTIQVPYQKVSLKKGVEQIGKLYETQMTDYPSNIAASMQKYGKGKIGVVYFDLGLQYFKGASATTRDFMNSLVKSLFPDPQVEVKGSHFIDVTLNRINGKLAINLINTAGPHNSSTVEVFDEIPPVGPLEISIKFGGKPMKVTLEPEGKELHCDYGSGKIKVIIPKIDVYSIVTIE